MKVLFCAYREWAIKTHYRIVDRCKSVLTESRLVRDPQELNQYAWHNKWDMIVLIGWSWKVPDDIVNSTLVVGMHPSNLPEYAGGSPLQHQIIDGVKESYATLFRLTEKFDAGEIIAKEPFSLQGHLTELFDSLSWATCKLIVKAIKQHPNHTFTKQEGGFSRRRLKPEQSELTREQLQTMTVRELYDFIRCREDPYPNVFVQDETGKLIFKIVEFES